MQKRQSVQKLDQTYLDYNASAPAPVELLSELPSLLRLSNGNPSSLHKIGRRSRKLINEATEAVASFIDCDAEFIYWTSGATEANSWALYSAARYAKFKGKSKVRFLISKIEHESTLMTAEALRKLEGVEVEFIPVNPNGQIDLEELKALLHQGPWDLVSVLYANNETGVIQPVEEVLTLCREFGFATHIDFVQALGKCPVQLRKLSPTYSTFSGHKLGAPKGVGFLVVLGEGRLLWPMIHGKQQKSLRAGTENPFGIAALGHVLKACGPKFNAVYENLACLHRDFEDRLKKIIPDTIIHGEGSPRLPNTSFVGFKGIDGDAVLMNLDLEGICASSGSACTSGSIDPSHVLLAMGANKEIARSSVRFSSGLQTTWADFEHVLKVLPDIITRVRGA